MSKEDFEALREFSQQKHAERVAKTPARLEYAQKQLDKAGIKYEIKNPSIGHVQAWNKDARLFQIWVGTGKIYNHKERGIWHFIRIIKESEEQ